MTHLSTIVRSPRIAGLAAALETGAELHLVGGTVRDVLLGLSPTDLDLATKLRPEIALARLRAAGFHVIETGLQHGTITVVSGGENVEITTFRARQGADFGESIAADLGLRDFTINAIAYDIQRGALLDPHGGISDLTGRRLRAVGDPTARLAEDPLRMLRAIRFGAAAGRSVDAALREAIRAQVDALAAISVERIRAELERILLAPQPAAAFRELLAVGLLQVVLPEMLPSVGCEQNEFHIHDVFEHTLWVIERTPADPLLRWAALFHDLGKPATVSVGEDGRRHFYRHEEVSTEIGRTVMKRLRFSNESQKGIATVVRYHMRPVECGPAGVRRLLRDLGEYFEPWREFKFADSPPVMGEAEVQARLTRFDEQVQTERKRQQGAPYGKLAVNGDDLAALGVAAGPGMGAILKTLRELVIEEPELNVREVLLARARELLGVSP